MLPPNINAYGMSSTAPYAITSPYWKPPHNQGYTTHYYSSYSPVAYSDSYYKSMPHPQLSPPHWSHTAPPNTSTGGQSVSPAAMPLPAQNNPSQNNTLSATSLPEKQSSQVQVIPDDLKKPAAHKQTHERDLFRHTSLRYMGYLNELGESFRGIIPNMAVRASYQLTGAYCFADALHKGYEGYKNTQGNFSSKVKQAASEATDAGAFQYLASYLVPAKIIELLAVQTKKFANNQAAWSPALKKWFPTAIGLGLIPLIIHPIDKATHFVLNHSVRNVLGRAHQDG